MKLRAKRNRRKNNNVVLTNISIDAHGGDKGLTVTLTAGLGALELFDDIFLIFVGDAHAIEKQLTHYQNAKKYQSRYQIYHAEEKIKMDETLVSALRKRNSSMRVAIQLVKENKAKACVSAGNSGALMAVSKSVLKTIDGISRPAMMSKIPTTRAHTHMLDLGANIDSKSTTLFEFALMASIAVEYTEYIKQPTISLLNIGSEDIKGKQIIKEAADLLKNSSLNYVGYIEADEIYTNAVDVVVCDGFEGNLVLKASEGVAQMIKIYLKRAFKKNLYTKLTASLAMPALNYFKSSLDPRRYNGANLLGLRGIVIKSHGSADTLAFLHAIKEARSAAQNEITDKIHKKIKQELAS